MKAAEQNQVSPIRILKSGTCSSLTGKSILTYHIGCEVNGDIHLRLFANTGGGFFNQDWIPLRVIEQRLDQHPIGKPITSNVLYPLFLGKSMNSPAFLLAVLKAEGLIEASKDKKRCHELCNPEGFMMAVKALMASPVDLKVAEKVVALPVKADTKPKSVSSKKTVEKSSPL
jgi:hypothetical protein